MIRVNLLADERLRQKFCEKRNRAVHCRRKLGCESRPMDCPLLHAAETQKLMIIKNASLGHAINMSLRREIERERIKDKIKKMEG